MAGLTLVGSLPQFTKDLTDCLSKAGKEAFLSTLSSGDDVDPAVATTIKADMELAATKFGMKLATTLAPDLSQAIYKFVSEIGITLTPKGTLLAPQAPSGVLPIMGTASTMSQDIVIT